MPGEENKNFFKQKTAAVVSHLSLMFRALKYRNYRLFIGGQSLSLIGTWIQMVAVTWLVYKLSNSAFILGIVGFSGQIPLFLIAPFAGVIADRWDKKKILLITQSMALVQALVLSILVFTGVIKIWHLVALSVFLGIINAFDMPIRQAFVVEMLDNQKQDISNAIALNSSMVNGARLIGPSIAGILIATVGDGWCFAINCISYLAVIISLFRMRIIRSQVKKVQSHVGQQLKEGFKYTFGFVPIKYLLLLLALVSLIGTPLTLLAPVFAKDFLHGDASTFGFLMSAYGTGALIGAVYLLNKHNVLGLGKLIAFAVFIFGGGMIAFALSRFLWLSIIIMMFSGLGMMLHVASTNTLLQTIAEENKRGRVMSFYAMAFRGMAPFGSLISGSLAGLIGAPLTLIIGGAGCLAAVTVYFRKLPALRPYVRPIYERMGLIPEMTTSVDKASNIRL
ncbi:MAG TPA: MFS transporter [Bacteroidales bacterium]|nr:MFS transporter [Bacteroidales bacterium]